MTCLYDMLVQLSQDLETVKQWQLETEKELNKTKGLLMNSNVFTDLILVDFNSWWIICVKNVRFGQLQFNTSNCVLDIIDQVFFLILI